MQNKLLENEQKLRELNASKDKFFSIIAHDLRSLFNSIIGLSEMMIEFAHERDFDSVEKYAPIVYNTSKHAFNLLENLLEWSRSQIGKMDFKPENLDIVSFLEEEIQGMQSVADNKSIRVELMYKKRFNILSDKRMLGSVVRNLLSNAIKFSYANSVVSVELIQDGERLIVSVCDHGVGIEEANLQKLFKLEESYTTVGTQNERGTGIGLLICKDFIEKHDGKLWVESQINQGSTFYFDLPITTAAV